MTDLVLAADFLQDNYLSNERRVPVTLLDTNACSPLATNALANNIWDNFSSQSYKDLPSVGTITVQHPLTGQPRQYTMPAGGRGYTRPPSLISLWSTAPFLLNNSVGNFNDQPSVEGRLASFNDSIEQLLWPEKRKKDSDVIRSLGLPESSAVDMPGYMYRTTATSYLKVAGGYPPPDLMPLAGFGQRWLPLVFGESGVEVGPIPKGTPVNLLANIRILAETTDLSQRVAHKERLVDLVTTIIRDLKAIERSGSTQAEREANALAIFMRSPIVDEMLAVNKCPDFVVNKGHYFGTDCPRRARPERPGQVVAHRVPQDLLTDLERRRGTDRARPALGQSVLRYSMSACF